MDFEGDLAEDFVLLANAISQNRTLTSLTINNDSGRITLNGAKALWKAIGQHPALSGVVLTCFDRDLRAVRWMANAIKQNQSLTHMDFIESSFCPEGLMMIYKAMKHNKSIRSIRTGEEESLYVWDPRPRLWRKIERLCWQNKIRRWRSQVLDTTIALINIARRPELVNLLLPELWSMIFKFVTYPKISKLESTWQDILANIASISECIKNKQKMQLRIENGRLQIEFEKQDIPRVSIYCMKKGNKFFAYKISLY